MDISSYPINNTPASVQRRPYVLYTIGSILLLAAIGGASWFFSPAGARWMADQTSAPPAIGITEVDLIADNALNHIFSPAVIQVETGTTVTWHFIEIDEDGVPVEHNVVFDDMASPVQATGTFSRSFNTPGTYQYVCTLHGFMEGAVVVVDG
ncbi:MAG: plastocyanin/azurin family copper-binding protein [Chloroflexota bacterium]